jgi:hypothetical protein
MRPQFSMAPCDWKALVSYKSFTSEKGVHIIGYLLVRCIQ